MRDVYYIGCIYITILVLRGCDPFGHGSRLFALLLAQCGLLGLLGSNIQSAIHGLSVFVRSLMLLSKW